MRSWQIKVLLVLLIGIFLFCDIALNFLSMPSGNSQTGRHVFLVWMGIWIAQPALLAIWAVFGSESLFIRLPRAVFLLCLVSLAATFGTWLNLAGRLDEDSLGLILSPFCQFAVLLPLLWLIRHFRNWHIVGEQSQGSSVGNRFSLMRFFAWQALILVVLLSGLFLFGNSWIDGSQGFPLETLGASALAGVFFGFISLPIVFLLGATLGRERKIKHALAAVFSACLLFGAALLTLWLVGGTSDLGDVGDILIVFVGFYSASVISLLVIRVMGYGLECFVDVDSQSTNVELPHADPTPNRRFAIAVGALGLLFLAMCPFANDLREQRIARAEDQKWLNMGVKASFAFLGDGDISQVSFLIRKPIQDDAFVALANCSRLTSVNLGSSRILDRHLELVGKLTTLDMLTLNNTQVTDNGLQHLKGMQDLRLLHLQMCPRVTSAGVRELQAAIPNCQIVFP